MSLIMKTVEVPASTREVVAAEVCELCGREGKDGGDYGDGMYDKDEVEVSLSVGSVYPEGGRFEKTILDICPDCFMTKLVTWFEAQGGKARKKEVDF